MVNRRNYYRILQVQPDAPIEVIKASYRTLMQTLKMHPDLGGDHWNAALINEAYKTLSDELTRKEYDKTLLKNYLGDSHFSSLLQAEDVCSFCKTPHEKIASYQLKKIAYVCSECQSPLGTFNLTQSESQRKVPRYEKKEPIIFYVYWPEPYFTGEIEDLSLIGMQFRVQEEILLLPNQIIKINSKTIRAIAKICYIQKNASVGVEFITISFEHKKGNFFNQMI